MDFITKQVFFFIFCNSSPTCRGRRILAIYYVKVCNSNHPSTLQFFNAPKLARHDLSGTMCIQKLMPSGFFLFLHAFNMRIYIDCQNTIVDCTRNIFFHISRKTVFLVSSIYFLLFLFIFVFSAPSRKLLFLRYSGKTKEDTKKAARLKLLSSCLLFTDTIL